HTLIAASTTAGPLAVANPSSTARSTPMRAASIRLSGSRAIAATSVRFVSKQFLFTCQSFFICYHGPHVLAAAPYAQEHQGRLLRDAGAHGARVHGAAFCARGARRQRRPGHARLHRKGHALPERSAGAPAGGHPQGGPACPAGAALARPHLV